MAWISIRKHAVARAEPGAVPDAFPQKLKLHVRVLQQEWNKKTRRPQGVLLCSVLVYDDVSLLCTATLVYKSMQV